MSPINLLGIVGGLGPMSSAYLYELITSRTKAARDQDHIDMIISSHATTPDRTAFIMGKSPDSPLPTMISDAQRLEAYGADAIVIACNTAHYFLDEVRASVSVPVPSIIRQTADFARFCGHKKIGIMATRGTVAAASYQRELESLGLEWVLPSDEAQKTLTSLIYDSVKAGGEIDRDKFYSVAAELEANGADAHILGCTELSVINSKLPREARFIDSTETLAYCAIRLCGRTPIGFPPEYDGWEPKL